jgi:pimeloyl-ACP methyl ester carboxylesterase
MWHSGRAIIQHDLTPRLARITAPALVLISTLDLMVANREGRLAAERIPGARLVVLHAGHMATDDRPAEVLQQLQEFLV